MKKKKIILKENQVLLNLSQSYYIVYLKYLFDFDEMKGLTLKRANKIGRHIYSLVKVSEFPKNPTPFKNSLIINIPSAKNFEHYENKFITVSKYNELQINAFIDASFHLHFHTFLLENRSKFKTRKKMIIAFRELLNMSDDDISLSTLSKNDQRFRKKTSLSS